MIRTIGRYEIESEVGRGSMGLVYRANDPVLRRAIALKTILLPHGIAPAAVQEFEERFFQEARAAARLSHPAIVVVHDVGRDPVTSVLYMALEFLDGQTIDQMTAGGRALDWREAVRIAEAVAIGLYHASLMGVVHRDVKPANIMALKSGQPKIMDFGIAKVETARLKLTAAGESFGTPHYMSPEQAFGIEANHQSDLFSLGATLYRMLTGRDAFAAASMIAIIKRVVDDDPEPPSRVQPGVPVALDLVTALVLAKKPEDRYPDTKALSEDLRDVLNDQPPRHASRRGASSVGTSTASLGWETLDLIEDQAFDPSEEIAELVSTPQTAPPTGVLRSRHLLGVPAEDAAQPASLPRPLRAAPVAGPRTRLSWQRLVPALLVVLIAMTLVGLLRKPAQRPIAVQPEAPAAPMATPKERSTPVPSEAPRAAPMQQGEAPATLLVDFEHGLKSGRLRVWVDDAVVLDERLDSRITKKVFGLKGRKGGVAQALEVGPGRHEIRVQVAWDDNERTKTISGTFRSGSTRRLAAKLGGVLDKNLSVEWE